MHGQRPLSCLSWVLVLSLAGGCDSADDSDGGGGGAPGEGITPVECAASDETPGGVGKPCEGNDDCKSGPRLECPPLTDLSGIRFCTKRCDHGAVPDSVECGPGAVCVYAGAGGRCVPAACQEAASKPAPVSDSSSVGRVNDQGVGQGCEDFLDCSGTTAQVCDAATREGGFDFCTTDCAYSFDDDERQCGPDATCAYVGGGRGLCVPTADAARLSTEPPPIVDFETTCCPGEVNGQGVGKPCTTHGDCAENAGAQSCPVAIHPDLPNWCTHLCDFGDDEGCGEGAVCWWRPSKVEVGNMVGSCAPVACKSDGDPPACDGT